MQKICIIGSGGAEKSTLARTIGRLLDLPVYHLDILFWKPGWEESESLEFKSKLKEVLEQPKWVMDGNFSGTFNIRLPEADAIIYLDFSRRACLFNIFKRYIKYRGETRQDLAEGCYEKLDWEFTKWVWNYPKRTKPNTLKTLSELKDKKIVILKNRKEVERFIRTLAK